LLPTFVVPTGTFRLVFVLVVPADDRRRMVHVTVTAHPTAAWKPAVYTTHYHGIAALLSLREGRSEHVWR